MNIISTIQYKPRLATCRADVSDNVRRAEFLLNAAFDAGSSIVALPELAFTGYTFLSKDQALSCAEPVDGPTYSRMARLANDFDCYIAYGYVESDGDKLHNSCNIIDPSGKIALSYRKINLWGNDFLWATPGKLPPVVLNTPLGKLSAVICRDIRVKVPSAINRVASAKPFFTDSKPDILILCSNWGRGGFPPVPWMEYSLNHQATLVVANRYGVEENGGFSNDFGSGGSIIIEPNWKVHTNGLQFNADCVITAGV